MKMVSSPRVQHPHSLCTPATRLEEYTFSPPFSGFSHSLKIGGRGGEGRGSLNNECLTSVVVPEGQIFCTRRWSRRSFYYYSSVLLQPNVKDITDQWSSSVFADDLHSDQSLSS